MLSEKDLNKFYTYEDFMKLMEDHPFEIGMYSEDPNTTDHSKQIYVWDEARYSADVEDWIGEKLAEGFEFMPYTLTKFDQLGEIETEARERIWYDRVDPDSEKDPDLVEKICEECARVAEQYHIDTDELDDFYHGYWSGILALSRYLQGWMPETDLDDLREGSNGLLDS